MNVLVANLISSIKIALKHKVMKSKTRYNKFVEQIIIKFVTLGVILDYSRFEIGSIPYISFRLNVVNNIPMIYDIKLISKSGRKVYCKVSELKKIKGIYFNLLVSTANGIMDFKECIENNISGEVVCLYT